MQVLQILRLNDHGRQGYLAVLDSRSRDGRQNAVKYIGSKYGENYQFCNDYSAFRVKTVRSSKQFDKYVKLRNPAQMVNPVRVGPVVFDLPFIHYGNGLCVKWEPFFEESVNPGSFSVISDGAIIEYNYQRPIYVSVLDMKRHVAAYNRERLLINANTFYTTRELSNADGNTYCECAYHVDNGSWVCDKFSKTPIAGWKSR